MRALPPKYRKLIGFGVAVTAASVVLLVNSQKRMDPTGSASQSRQGPMAAVTLAWEPNPEPDVTGYKLEYGTTSGTYTETMSVGANPNPLVTVANLIPETDYYFAVKAVNEGGIESEFSNEIRYSPQGPVPTPVASPTAFPTPAPSPTASPGPTATPCCPCAPTPKPKPTPKKRRL